MLQEGGGRDGGPGSYLRGESGMRAMMAIAAALALGAVAWGQAGDKGKVLTRYGIEEDAKRYPQNTPKDALGSVLKALGDKRVDYLLAHLADPAFVDQRVKQDMARMGPELKEDQKKSLAFDRLTKKTTESFREDPTKLKELQRFFNEGEWEEGDNAAVARLKNLQARKVFMKKVAPERWVLLDREK
jgi:hypothetical protein